MKKKRNTPYVKKQKFESNSLRRKRRKFERAVTNGMSIFQDAMKQILNKKSLTN